MSFKSVVDIRPGDCGAPAWIYKCDATAADAPDRCRLAPAAGRRNLAACRLATHARDGGRGGDGGAHTHVLRGPTMAAARQEDEGNGNAGPTVSMDPQLTVHWEMEFGRPIFSSGLIARLWVDKLKERWVRDELEAERAQPGSWPRRIRVVLE